MRINKFLRQLLVFAIACAFFPAGRTMGDEYTERESPVVRAVGKVGSAVVNISTEYEVRGRSNPFSGFGMDPRLDFFFRDFFDHRQETQYKRSSLGSGVIIDGKRGFILTNAHVIAETAKIIVTMLDEREFEARVIGADPDSDLAVLRIDPDQSLPSVEMGKSDDLMIGETVIAIGNPFGFSHTVTTGVISAINRSIRTEDRVYSDFIQTDASINPGNSGGPLLNIRGELIGINTAIYAKAQGIGFAIPIDRARRIFTDLIDYGEVVPAWIGILAQDMDEQMASYLRLPGKKGVMVKSIEEGSPAQTAGIHEGDILVALDGKKIVSGEGYYADIRAYSAGAEIRFTLMREGETIERTVKASVFPSERAMDLAYRLMGIRVTNLDDRIRRHYRIPADSGVMIAEIKPQSYLARVGADVGDVIRQIGDMAIREVKDFEKAVIKYRDKTAITVLLQRGGRGYYITVEF